MQCNLVARAAAERRGPDAARTRRDRPGNKWHRRHGGGHRQSPLPGRGSCCRCRRRGRSRIVLMPASLAWPAMNSGSSRSPRAGSRCSRRRGGSQTAAAHRPAIVPVSASGASIRIGQTCTPRSVTHAAVLADELRRVVTRQHLAADALVSGVAAVRVYFRADLQRGQDLQPRPRIAGGFEHLHELLDDLRGSARPAKPGPR